MKNRPNLDEYFLKFAMLAAERSTCLRHNVGAIIVKDKHILSTGYNGAPKKTLDCTVLGCLRDELKIPSGTRHEICRAVHAEQNAIIQAAYHGTSVEGGTMYCTHTPCIICAKMIINAGIKRFVTYRDYSDKSFLDVFLEAGVKFEKLPRPDNNIVELDRIQTFSQDKKEKELKTETSDNEKDFFFEKKETNPFTKF